MALSRTLYAVHDNEFGVGAQLAFPTMSTCAACVVVLANRLVGVHKTSSWDLKHFRLFQLARAAIGTSPIARLYIAGWNVGDPACHDIGQIRTYLQCQHVPTYVFDYHNSNWTIQTTDGGLEMVRSPAFKPGLFVNRAIDLCTFAFHNNNGYEARIGVKRTSKATVNDAGRNGRGPHSSYCTGMISDS